MSDDGAERKRERARSVCRQTEPCPCEMEKGGVTQKLTFHCFF